MIWGGDSLGVLIMCSLPTRKSQLNWQYNNNERLKIMKKIVSLALVLLLCFASVGAFADDEVTIPAGSNAKKGTDLIKESSSAEPIVNLIEISSGSSIKFWIWRKDIAEQVTNTFTFNSYGYQDVTYKSGKKARGEYYHAVWRRTTQNINSPVTVNFAFIP